MFDTQSFQIMVALRKVPYLMIRFWKDHELPDDVYFVVNDKMIVLFL